MQPDKLQCCIWRDSVKPSLQFSCFYVLFGSKGNPFWLNQNAVTHLVIRIPELEKKCKRKVKGVPQAQAAAIPRHEDEEETDKTKQAQIEQTYEKHQD